VVGDRVRVVGERLVRLDRDNELRRRAPGGGVNTVAANLDLVIVVVAPEPPPRTGLVDRCAVAARAAGIGCALVINKADLPAAGDVERRFRAVFGEAMPIVTTSAETGEGTDELRALIQASGRSILCGHSGVGKSSITNRLIPGLALEVNTLSDASGRGRHTTTVSTLHALESGGELVDTPGFREFGLVEIEPLDLAAQFVGFEELPACRFRDCLHNGEPGCGLDEAVDDGSVPEERRASYRALLAELLDQQSADRT
jgi:ribosome biogenesis GTPase